MDINTGVEREWISWKNMIEIAKIPRIKLG